MRKISGLHYEPNSDFIRLIFVTRLQIKSLNSFIDNPSENWIDGVEALGQVIFIATGGAEAELFYNVGVAVFDQIREH